MEVSFLYSLYYTDSGEQNQRGGGGVLEKAKGCVRLYKRLDLAFGGWSRSGPEVLFNRKRRKVSSS